MLNLTATGIRDGDVGFANFCGDQLRKLGNESMANSNHTSNPWFLYCSMRLPHPPFLSNSTYLVDVNYSAIEIPPEIPFETISTMHPYYQYMSRVKNVTSNYTDEQIRDIRYGYYGLNVETNQVLEIVWDALIESGFNLSNTIVVFSSDHGEMAMDHRQVWKNGMYEGSTRVPLIFAGPGIEKGKIVTNITQLIDVIPTFLELATSGLYDDGDGDDDTYDISEIEDNLEGFSLVSFLNDTLMTSSGTNNNQTQFHDYIFSEFYSDLGNTGSFMIRKGDYKYVQFGHYLSAYQNYSSILYNTENDPKELVDLAQNASYTDVLNEMENILVNLTNYEYYDCLYKRNDYYFFKNYYWDVYNQSYLFQLLSEEYWQFDHNDWKKLQSWFCEIAMLDTLGYNASCDCLLDNDFSDCVTSYPVTLPCNAWYTSTGSSTPGLTSQEPQTSVDQTESFTTSQTDGVGIVETTYSMTVAATLAVFCMAGNIFR